MPDTVHQQLRAHVTGRVQGVGFRYFTRRTARRLGLVGWVRNEPDGSVRTLAEGPRADLEAFLEALHRGPTGSRVDWVRVDWTPAEGAHAGFEVTY